MDKKLPIADPRRIVIQSLLISVLCHVGCLSLFVFTIAERSSPPKPFIIFLGSILQKRDLVNRGTMDTVYLPGPIPPMTSGIGQPYSSQAIHAPAPPQKPILSTSTITKPKKPFKDTRTIPIKDTPEPTTVGRGAETVAPAPKRIPLKLYPDDQN